MPPGVAVEFYGLWALCRLLDLTDSSKARSLLGSPDAILATSETKQFPLWSKQRGTEVWRLPREWPGKRDRNFVGHLGGFFGSLPPPFAQSNFAAPFFCGQFLKASLVSNPCR
jgi:hypothetical protein